MELEVLRALNFFHEQSKAQAVFIKLEDSVACMIKGNKGQTIGMICHDEMPELIKQLGNRTIEIIAEPDQKGKYQLPDIDRLKAEM